MFKRLTALFAVLLVISVGVSLAVWYLPLTNKEPIRIEIQPKQTLTQLAEQWQQDGWLPSSLLLRVQARIYGNPLRVGEYELPVGLNSAELLPFLATAMPITYRLTLIEGQRLQQALDALGENQQLIQDVQPLNEVEVRKLLSIDGSAEGWIYPDTYVYHKGDKVSTLLNQAYQRMQQHLEQAWQQRAANLPYTTPYEALIMASIVEKETGMAIERSRIAGVFIHRLEKRMRLETDPTVIYGLGSDFKGNLTRKHLQDRSNPWNTYRHFGLPPTPIALVGREALEAALNPAVSDELFFVARGDGSHVFSSTLEAHNKAVRHYQITNRAKNYRSAPITEPDNKESNE